MTINNLHPIPTTVGYTGFKKCISMQLPSFLLNHTHNILSYEQNNKYNLRGTQFKIFFLCRSVVTDYIAIHLRVCLLHSLHLEFSGLFNVGSITWHIISVAKPYSGCDTITQFRFILRHSISKFIYIIVIIFLFIDWLPSTMACL